MATAGGRKRYSAKCSPGTGTRWFWPPSSAISGWTWATAWRPGPQAAGPISAARWRRRCAGCVPTTWICTSCTRPTRSPRVEETLRALGELVSAGKVRYLGHSNLTGWQTADADHVARQAGTEPFISARNHWSLLERQAEAELVPAARQFGLGVLPYFPLGQRPAHGQGPPRPGTAARQQAGQPAAADLAELDKIVPLPEPAS
jgi:diketogulonate reductase-like aldo/keto reductase